jgi:hypothetical protein
MVGVFVWESVQEAAFCGSFHETQTGENVSNWAEVSKTAMNSQISPEDASP